MNLAHFHTSKIIPIYTQGRSNKFESCVTVLKHRMYKREHRRWQARVGESGSMLPLENFEKSVQ